MDRICLNCKHWGGVNTPGVRSMCAKILEQKWDEREKAEPEKAVVQSGSYAEGAGDFWTTYDFGCTLFEAKS